MTEREDLLEAKTSFFLKEKVGSSFVWVTEVLLEEKVSFLCYGKVGSSFVWVTERFC